MTTIVGGFDTETTGLKQEEGHRIIEFAFVLHDLDTGKCLGKVAQRINPERAIDPGSYEVHKIGLDQLLHEPTWPVVAPKLAALLGRCQYVVAHNGVGFDAPFVQRELIRIGIAPPPMFMVDTMLQGRWATPDGALPNLKALCFACGVPYDTTQAHAALYDVEVMMACFLQQYPRGFFQLPTEPYQLPKVSAS